MTVSYDVLKTLHLLAVILWIGPALGAYWTLFATWQRGDKAAILAAEEDCERVLRLEHIAFGGIIVTGVAMLSVMDFALVQTQWMQQKLGLFGVILAFELFDMWVGHRVLPRALTSVDAFDSPAGQAALRARVWVMRLAIPVGACILAVVWLAVSK